MENNSFTCSAVSTMLPTKWAFCSPVTVGLGSRSGFFSATSLKAPLPRPSGLVVKAQLGGSPKNYGKKAAHHDETYPFVRTPSWNATEDDHEFKMWLNMPGRAPEDVDVNIIDDLLEVKGAGGVDAFGNKMFGPYESSVQLPLNSWKGKIAAMFKNDVLYINVPKITKSVPVNSLKETFVFKDSARYLPKVTKFGPKFIHVPVRSE